MITISCRHPNGGFVITVTGAAAKSGNEKYQALLDYWREEYSPADGDPELWMAGKAIQFFHGHPGGALPEPAAGDVAQPAAKADTAQIESIGHRFLASVARKLRKP